MNIGNIGLYCDCEVGSETFGLWHVLWTEDGQWKVSRKFETEAEARTFAQQLKEERNRQSLAEGRSS